MNLYSANFCLVHFQFLTGYFKENKCLQIFNKRIFFLRHRSAVSSDGGKHQEEEEGEEDDDKTPTDENQVDEEEESKPAPEPEQPATTTADPEDKLTRRERLDKSHRIAEELLSTEEQYVSVLHLIDQV